MFHSQTRLKDFTGSGQIGAGVAGSAPMMVMRGRYRIEDFEWPTTYAVGVAFEPNPRWLVAADIKRIRWSETMERFQVAFSTAAGGDLRVEMMQRWRDQTIYALGVEYRPNPDWALRAGFNYGKNPVPDAYLHPLFPATAERHWTFGVGIKMTPRDTLAASLAIVPEVSRRIPAAPGLAEVRVAHAQTTFRLNWNHRF